MKKVFRAVGISSLFILAFFAVVKGLPRVLAEKHAIYESPDGDYKIVVKRFPSLFGRMPGQASDAPGLVQLWALPISYKKSFDIKADLDFQNYRAQIEDYAHKHSPTTANDFCIVGYFLEDNTKLAWILWTQGRQAILYGGASANLESSRRILNLEKDVVETEDDLHGSTYLVTRSWVDSLKESCNKVGTKIHIEPK